MKADADRHSDIMEKTVSYIRRIGKGPDKSLETYGVFQIIDKNKDGKIAK